MNCWVASLIVTAYSYGWNVEIQICEICQNGSSLFGCSGPCYNMCERNEDCFIDANGIGQCVCKAGHTLLSLNGNCQSMLFCDNGTMTKTNWGWSCQCNEGYNKSKDGRCLKNPSVICFYNLPDCVADHDNDITCVCPNGSVIESGMCATDCTGCETNEECSIDGSGGINCTCVEDYTWISSSDSCFHTLSYPLPKETLRMTENMDFICTCKEGYIRLNDPDEIVCLDYSNNKSS